MSKPGWNYLRSKGIRGAFRLWRFRVTGGCWSRAAKTGLCGCGGRPLQAKFGRGVRNDPHACLMTLRRPTAFKKNSLTVSCFVVFARIINRQGEKSDSYLSRPQPAKEFVARQLLWGQSIAPQTA